MPRTRRPPSLPRLLAELLAEADLRGESAEKRLEGGATLKARSKLVAVAEGQQRRRQLIIGRQGTGPGESELVTFRRDGRIPAEAEEASYQRGDWVYVAVTWDAPAIELPLADLPPGL